MHKLASKGVRHRGQRIGYGICLIQLIGRGVNTDEVSGKKRFTYSKQKTCPHSIEQGALESCPKRSKHISQLEPGPRLSMAIASKGKKGRVYYEGI